MLGYTKSKDEENDLIVRLKWISNELKNNHLVAMQVLYWIYDLDEAKDMIALILEKGGDNIK